MQKAIPRMVEAAKNHWKSVIVSMRDGGKSREDIASTLVHISRMFRECGLDKDDLKNFIDAALDGKEKRMGISEEAARENREFYAGVVRRYYSERELSAVQIYREMIAAGQDVFKVCGFEEMQPAVEWIQSVIDEI